MNCEKCGREIDVIEADMFNREGNDDWVRFVIHSEAGSEAVCIDITADWTGYDLTHDEGLECVRCPHCHQYPFKNENFEIDDKTVGIIFWPDTENIKKPTNLDRIREMSVKELAEYICNLNDGNADFCQFGECPEKNVEILEDWLKQEAEE